MFIILPFFFLFLLVFRVVFLFHLEIILVMRQTYQFCQVTIGPLEAFLIRLSL